VALIEARELPVKKRGPHKLPEIQNASLPAIRTTWQGIATSDMLTLET